MRDTRRRVGAPAHETQALRSPFAYLVTVLLFARVGPVRRPRARARASRGSSRRCSRSTVDRAGVRARQRRALLELLHLLRHAVLRASSTSATLRWVYERVTGWLLRAAGYRRRAVLVGSGKHIEDGRARARRRGRTRRSRSSASSRSTPRPRQRAALARRSSTTCRACSTRDRVQEVIIADPDFPQEHGGRARRQLPPARRDRARRAVDDGDPRSTAPSSCPASRCRCSAAPAGVRGRRLRAQADVRPRRRRSLLLVAALARCCSLIALAVKLTSRGPVIYRSVRPGHRRRAVRLLQVPHDARATPSRSRPTSRRSTRLDGAAVQDPRRPAADAGRAAPAPLLARRAAAARQRAARRDVARRPAAAAAARLRAARGVAQEALPRAARDHRAVAGLGPRRSSTSTTSCGSTSSTSSAGRSSSTCRSC